MRILVHYSDEFSDEALAAFARYHGIDTAKRRELSDRVRSVLEQVGTMGFEEQVHEGRQWLAGDVDRAEGR